MVIKDLLNSARERLRDRSGLVLLFGIYVGLLLSLALFVATSVATIKQVLLTLVMLVAVPAIFFLLPAVCLTRDQAKNQGTALRTWWRTAAISIPLLLLSLILFKSIGRIELGALGPNKTSVVFTFLRVAIFGIGLPLALIRLWIATAAEGFPRSPAQLRSWLAGAFGPRPVLTYLIGAVISGGIAGALFFVRVPLQQENAQIVSLIVRDVLGLLVIFFGLIVTLTAMRKAQGTTAPAQNA